MSEHPLSPAQVEVFRVVAEAIASADTDRFASDIALNVLRALDETYYLRAPLRGLKWPLLTPPENFT